MSKMQYTLYNYKNVTGLTSMCNWKKFYKYFYRIPISKNISILQFIITAFIATYYNQYYVIISKNAVIRLSKLHRRQSKSSVVQPT